MVESSAHDHMTLLPGKAKCYSFSFVAKTEDVGKKIEVRLCADRREGQSAGSPFSDRVFAGFSRLDERC